MKTKKGIRNKIIIAVIVIILAAGGIYAAVVGNAIEVSTALASYGSIEKLITETGTIEAQTGVVVSSKIQGQLSEVNVKEGDAVTEGQRLASYTVSGAADIAGIRAEISGLQVRANQANALATTNRKLYEEGAMSYEDYNQAAISARQIEAQISALNHTIAGLSEAGGAAGVIAPISGHVTSVMVRGGETVAPGTPIIEISDISNVHVKVNLVAGDADEVTEGDKVRILSENERLIDDSAKVSKIYLMAQDILSDLGVVQKRVPLEISLSAEQNLRLGGNVRVEIIIDERENTLIVPSNAIFEINREHHVYIVENRRAVLTRIEIGLEGERYTEILSGLTEGDIIITSPPRQVGDGAAVKII